MFRRGRVNAAQQRLPAISEDNDNADRSIGKNNHDHDHDDWVHHMTHCKRTFTVAMSVVVFVAILSLGTTTDSASNLKQILLSDHSLSQDKDASATPSSTADSRSLQESDPDADWSHAGTSSESLQFSKQVNANWFVFTDCLHQVLNELPIGQGRLRKYKAMDRPLSFEHHMRAATGLWNMDRRFDPLPVPGLTSTSEDCSIWEVGANEKAADSEEFMKNYPRCEYHGFEPVPTFHSKLEQYWKKKKDTDAQIQFTAHNYGIDSQGAILTATEDLLEGEGTYLGDAKASNGGSGNAGTMEIKIKAFAQALSDTTYPTSGVLPTLFHVNCEGCEWEMLPNLLTSDDAQEEMFRSIPVIQFGTHNYGKNLGQRAWELCEIREKLSESHRMEYGVAFGWERWVKK